MSENSKETGVEFTSIRIIGSGLIGTSIGLALSAKGLKVEMADKDASAAKLAQDLVASEIAPNPQVILIATPVGAIAEVASSQYLLNPKAIFIDIASVKAKPQLEISSSTLPEQRFLATHPMAGREVGGAASARADLFSGRSWIYCPVYGDGGRVDQDVLDAGLWLICALGAKPVEMKAVAHDKAIALISHLPQIAASLLAGQLHQGAIGDLELSGAGLRDSVRIAASDPDLWEEIILSNSPAILPLLINLQSDLQAFIAELQSGRSIKSFLSSGVAGRARIPGKHGQIAREYTQLPIVIEDKPGQLAALFDECATAKVNVEDLTIEHSPGQFTGLITLALSNSDALLLQQHLEGSGWNVHAPR